MSKKWKMRAGFTLIELAIVLVVIGLVVGGILTGRSLIAAAQVQNELKQMHDIEVQMATFMSKYGCPPGDCPNATVFLGSTHNGYNYFQRQRGRLYQDQRVELWHGRLHFRASGRNRGG